VLKRASEVARVVEGHLVGDDVAIAGATQDSRTVVPGSLFVPLVAERDGHDFIDAARAAGAAAYLSARGHRGGTAILVDDTARALQLLGAAARDLLPDRVVGVTGSVGKTSTKDLVAAVLATTYRTHASDRSFNNEIGVPLTLLNVPHDTEAVVVEKGARGRGHIASLCAIARPTIGIVTVVGGAHLELFGTIDDVAHTKGELVEALPPGGVAVLNADDHRVAAMASRTTARVLTYGSRGEVRGTRIQVIHDLTSRFELHTPWGRATVVLGVRGRHNVDNALAAASAGLAAGVELDAVVEGLRAPAASPWRMDLRRTARGAAVLNDAYNANPVSVQAALEALVHLPARRRVAVLGPMAELGVSSAAEHRRIGELARSLGVGVIAVDAPEYGGEHAAGIDEALALLGPVDADVAVLVKGSRVAGLERLVARLLDETA
jgi:UDP-N-acetylmuramoyl-tripeptide--D-alanyl-D-alanine ligase